MITQSCRETQCFHMPQILKILWTSCRISLLLTATIQRALGISLGVHKWFYSNSLPQGIDTMLVQEANESLLNKENYQDEMKV